MSRYVLTTEAQENLVDIVDYLTAEAGIRVSRYVLGRLVAGFRGLASAPGKGHQRPDLTVRKDLRFWPVFSYLIIYKEGTEPLEIVAVTHAKRDVSRFLEHHF